MDVNVPSILLMRVLDDSRVAYNVTSTELSSCSPPFFSLMRRCESCGLSCFPRLGGMCRTKGTFLPRPRDMWTASSESACAVNLHDCLLHLCRTTLQTPLPKRVNRNLLHLGTALGIQVGSFFPTKSTVCSPNPSPSIQDLILASGRSVTSTSAACAVPRNTALQSSSRIHLHKFDETGPK